MHNIYDQIIDYGIFSVVIEFFIVFQVLCFISHLIPLFIIYNYLYNIYSNSFKISISNKLNVVRLIEYN